LGFPFRTTPIFEDLSSHLKHNTRRMEASLPLLLRALLAPTRSVVASGHSQPAVQRHSDAGEEGLGERAQAEEEEEEDLGSEEGEEVYEVEVDDTHFHKLRDRLSALARKMPPGRFLFGGRGTSAAILA
jgi:hypothetical protein